jgi:hypothetical protein
MQTEINPAVDLREHVLELGGPSDEMRFLAFFSRAGASWARCLRMRWAATPITRRCWRAQAQRRPGHE